MSIFGLNESRKRTSERASISDSYEFYPVKEPHYHIVGNLEPSQETSRIRTLSSQSSYIPQASIVSQFERMNFMRNRQSLKDILFSPKVSFAFRNDSGSTTGIRGLMNLGNTCYMNAAIQALSNCPPIRDYFCLLNFETFGNNSNADVSMAFRDLLNKIWSDSSQAPIKPINFLFQVRSKCPQFRGFGQQDSQEFIRCFLDVLHQELKYPIESNSKPLLSPSTLSTSSSAVDDQADTVDSGMSTENESSANAKETVYEEQKEEDKVENSEKHENDNQKSDGEKVDDEKEKPTSSDKKVNYESLISVIFDGQLISTVKCLTCQHLSNTNETFQDISLGIPSIEQLEKMKEAFAEAETSKASNSTEVSTNFSYMSLVYGFTSRWIIHPWFSWISNFYRYMFSGSISLEDCLCAFFSVDYLRGDDMYRCERCSKLRNGVKQCRLKSLPEILCIHLKRFRHDTLYNTKINTRITFPLRDLDLEPYMEVNGSEESEESEGGDKNYMYDLISIVSHRGGSVDFGHYISYCFNQIDGWWYKFDDSFVHPVHEEEVANAEAYILFYQKRSPYALNEVDDF